MLVGLGGAIYYLSKPPPPVSSILEQDKIDQVYRQDDMTDEFGNIVDRAEVEGEEAIEQMFAKIEAKDEVFLGLIDKKLASLN